jgi:hypothetical protein
MKLARFSSFWQTITDIEIFGVIFCSFAKANFQKHLNKKESWMATTAIKKVKN